MSIKSNFNQVSFVVIGSFLGNIIQGFRIQKRDYLICFVARELVDAELLCINPVPEKSGAFIHQQHSHDPTELSLSEDQTGLVTIFLYYKLELFV